ncbi:hypothetical protein OG889_27000 [Streptomyces sp. NBC_00481]|uniref:hypothetical protein n=1 Tax=Streptomyces sp. NBC_00481 TaxID=2975755 RepID=UPI002DD9E26F|nr:hypothetical protein [Streptomyces sp. NBC_00481]WRY98021.1 hypothetical protein OG889_27000 [Streptomyces sp. NBC_00481]
MHFEIGEEPRSAPAVDGVALHGQEDGPRPDPSGGLDGLDGLGELEAEHGLFGSVRHGQRRPGEGDAAAAGRQRAVPRGEFDEGAVGRQGVPR